MTSAPRLAAPSRTRRLGAASGAVLIISAALALVAAPARAAAPSGFLGTQAVTVPSEDDFERLGRANIRVYRHNIVWRSVEGRRGRYDWTRYDRMFARAAANGVRVMPVLLGSPVWANRDIHHPPAGASNRRAYYQFAGAVAERYGPGGRFWRTQPRSSAGFAARHLQFWNEPNLPNWWNDDADPAEYARLLKGGSRAARRANPAVGIVMAGMPESRHSHVVPLSSFLRSVYRVPGAREAFDYVAVHPYSRRPSGVIDIVERTRAVMNAAGDRRKTIWITEFGWATGGGHPDFSVSYSRQASYLRQTLAELMSRRSSLGVRGAVWYLFRDSTRLRGSLGGWQSQTGLFTNSDAPKPAWRTLVELARPKAG